MANSYGNNVFVRINIIINEIYRYNVTNTEEPSFLLESIDALTSPNHAMRRDDEHQVMKAIVFAVNQKGRSPGVIVKDFTINSDPNLPGI